MKLAAVFWCLLTVLPQASSATPIEPLAQKWAVRYNSPANLNDFSSAVAVDSAGDIYTLGYAMISSSNANPVLIKNGGITGAKIWDWRLTSPQVNNPPKYSEALERVARLRLGTDGNLVVLASPHLCKIRASDGMQVWAVTLPDSFAYDSGYNEVALDAAGDIFVCGNAYKAGTRALKFSGETGAKLWERSIPTGAALDAISVDSDGNAIVTGSGMDPSARRWGLYTAKYSGLDGSVRWEKYLSYPNETLSARLITVDSNNDPIVATTSALILKYSAPNGSLIWQRQAQASPYDLICDSADNIFVASSNPTTAGAAGATLSKYAAADGTLRWSKSTSGEFYCSLLLRNSEVLVAGQRQEDLLLLAFDSVSGSRRWDATYGALQLKDRMANTRRPNGRIALQSDGGVFITGCSEGTSTGFDFVTVRYAPGPTVKAAGAEWVLQNSAKLAARASANGKEATLFWEYGPTQSYGQTTIPIPIHPTATPFQYYFLFETTVTGLPENTTFHARAVATSAAGITYGEDFTFTTGWDANKNGIPDQWELDYWEETWKLNYWGNTLTNSASADDDRDGLPNLLEYAFDKNPLVPDSPGAVPITQVGDYLTATITKQPFVTYIVEASSDLQSWSPADTTVLVDNATTLTVRGNLPISSGGTQFLRIQVTSQEAATPEASPSLLESQPSLTVEAAGASDRSFRSRGNTKVSSAPSKAPKGHRPHRNRRE